MTVYFIGAGPGAADLMTLRAQRLVRRCPVVLYAGSLIPEEVVAEAGADVSRPPEGGLKVLDTAPMALDAIISEIETAHTAGLDVARLQSGDPSLYGAIAEQIRRLDALGIPWEICPGVPAYAAAAAALGRELTLPNISQTVILTRTAVRTGSMPNNEDLVTLGRSGATLAIHLSTANLGPVMRDLAPLYGEDCPVAVVYRASWPDQGIERGTISTIRDKVKARGWTRTALIIVGRVLTDEAEFPDSHLYHAAHSHVLRPQSKD